MPTKTMSELRAAGLPVMHWHDILEDRVGEMDEESSLQLDAYFGAFVRVEKADDGLFHCLACDAPLSGFVSEFRWTLISGEGECSRCHYPNRAHHSVGFVKFLPAILQYHPSCFAD